MKAKKLIGVVAGAALTMTTVFGSAMPVFADVVDTPAVETSEPSAEPTQTEDVQTSEPTQTEDVQTSEPTQTENVQTSEPTQTENVQTSEPETPVTEPQSEPSVQQQSESMVQGEPVAEQQQADPAEGASDDGADSTSPEEDAQGEEQGAQDQGAANDQESMEKQQDSAETSTEADASASASEGLLSNILNPLSDDEGQAGISAGSLEASQSADATLQAYEPITIDGDFSDWEGHQPTSVNDQKLSDMDMVWSEDGGLCIYLKEADGQWHGIATNTGARSNGQYVITSDTGRQFVFQLKYENGKVWAEDGKGNKLDGVTVVCKEGQTNDASGQYHPTGNQYEIKVDPGVFKTYNQSVSLGYYLTEGQSTIVQNVANPYTAEKAGLGELKLDENFGEWDHYQHDLIEYSKSYADAEGALYSDGDELWMHVATYKQERDTRFYNDITVRFNENDNQCVNLKLAVADAQGNLSYPYDLWDQTPGKTYTYYLIDENGWSLYSNINKNIYSDQFGYGNGQKQQWLYGKIIVKVTATGTEMEVESDLSEYANRLNLDRTSLKRIEAYFENIGQTWISCAGTSSGPVPGILMGTGIAVLAAWGYKKKEKGEVSDQG